MLDSIRFKNPLEMFVGILLSKCSITSSLLLGDWEPSLLYCFSPIVSEMVYSEVNDAVAMPRRALLGTHHVPKEGSWLNLEIRNDTVWKC